MSRPVVARLAVPAVLAAALAVPTVASAAVTGSVLLPCHSNSPLGSADEPIEVGLSGGTPGAAFRVLASLPGRRAGGVGSTTGTFDGDGDATARILRLGGLGRAVSAGRPVALAVQEGAGAPVTVAETLVTNFTVDVATHPTGPGARRRVRVSGTPFAEQRVSAFLVRASGGPVLRRTPLGRADACGFLRRTVAVAPRSLAPGAYRVYVGTGTKLRRSQAIYDRLRVR
ncbi:hypothetical protein [Patulibacter sp.]|uniref:hypothetical protein n=1 Tax=Patulibacter sp. TaxID=1912859 RepID=UPI00271763F7|nr:hypothetical protein [Patulibacter sp.]MDO9406805.1 hypothetical protein [Patulibacter sp.]